MKMDNILMVNSKLHQPDVHPNQFTKKKSFSWFEELINAGILAGITFISSITVSGDVVIGIKIGLVSSALTFLTRLAFKRGLIPK